MKRAGCVVRILNTRI